MFKEKLLQVRDKFIEQLEKLWNENKEEIAEAVEKKLGFVKPIKLYSQIDTLFYIFDGLWGISNYWNEEGFELERTHNGYWCRVQGQFIMDIEYVDVEVGVTQYHFSFANKEDVCSFWLNIRPKKIVEMEIHNKEYDAQHIINTLDAILDVLQPYRKQVDEYTDKQKKKELYSFRQARELETII